MSGLVRRLVIGLLLVALLGGQALALEEDELIEEQAEALGVDELEEAVPEEAQELLDGVELGTGVDFTEGLKGIWANVTDSLGGVFRQAARSAATVMVIAMLCGLVGAMYEGTGSSVPDYVPLVGVLAVAVAAVGTTGAFISLGVETLERLDTFSKVLLPTMTAAATASGALTSAAAKYAATVMFMDVLITLSRRVIMPLIYAYMAASIGSAAIGGGGLDGAARLLRWMANILITVVMIAFVAYVTVTGVVSGSADAVTTRVAKTAISTALPVVGGIISDAAGTVVAGASMVKNAIGVIGLLVVLAVCLMPILQLGAHYLMYKAAAGVSAAVTDSKITKVIDSLGSAFGMIMGLVGAGAIMMFFSIISMMRMATG